jgi:hypothetical protein
MMTKGGLFAATVFSAVMVCSARDINAQPHINVTQGQPLAGTQNDEFELMVRYGMTRIDAIRSATSIAAKALRMSRHHFEGALRATV